jgi:hypothetical protein
MDLQRLLTLLGYSWRRKWHEGDKGPGGADRIYLAFDYICLSDFLFAHIVTPSLSPPLLKKLRVAGNSPAKKLSLQLKMLRSWIRNRAFT